MKLIKIFLPICFIFLLILSACSAKKNTFTSRAYHNLTAYYNVHFNGQESFKEGLQKIDEAHRDNFTIVLPVFVYNNENSVKAGAAEMDKCIAKSAKLIKQHSITARPKRKPQETDNPYKAKSQKEFYEKPDYCNYVDDAYMLMGKGHFYKYDFEAAIKTFEVVTEKFAKYDVKYEALLWLSRCYLQIKKFNDTKRILDVISTDKKCPKFLEKDILLTYADFYLRQQKYDDGLTFLEKVILLEKKKNLKARYKFIAAQIYQRNDNCYKASLLYSEVIKINPQYDLVFNSQINRAACFTSGDASKLRKELEKMLKDDKNFDYQDQIYFALAKLAERDNDKKSAEEYYKLSAKTSISNPSQKAMSFLALADIYFSRPEYLLAQAYYDSTMTSLDRNYPDYDKIALKTRNLSDLVNNLNEVQRQDSLQRVAKMSEKERNEFIDDLIQKVKEEEQTQKKENQLTNQENRQNQQQSGGKWYFYNPTAMGLGKTEFLKRWGNRRLEDNWRRKNKASVQNDDEKTDNSADSTETLKKKLSNKKREYYLVDLPLSEEKVQKSDEKIAESMFNVGVIYAKKMNDKNEAIKAFEAFISRFPTHKHSLEANYQLYELYKSQDNAAKADEYKNKIIQQFPNSHYAKLLGNPEYLSQIKEKERKATQLYDQAYSEFVKKNYPSVVLLCSNAETQYPDNLLMEKFLFIKALSNGELGKTDSLTFQLERLIAKFPNSEVKPQAEGILKTLKSGKLNPNFYSFDEKQPHLYVIILSKNTDINRVMFNLTNHNLDFFASKSFQTDSVAFNEQKILLGYKPFNNKTEAMEFYRSVIVNQVHKDFKPNEYRHFVISVSNQKLFLESKDIDKYDDFFKQNYSK